MEKDVDPNDTGSFDQMNLISLIARRPRNVETIEEMIEAIKVLTQDNNTGDEKEAGDWKRSGIKCRASTLILVSVPFPFRGLDFRPSTGKSRLFPFLFPSELPVSNGDTKG